MVQAFYLVVLIASLIITGYFLFRSRQNDTIFLFFEINVIANSLGRYMVASAQSLDVAIIGNKFLYVGACYCPLALILEITQICEIRFPKWLKYGLLTFSTVVLCLSLSIGKYDFFYKDVSLEQGNGFHYLAKTYGPWHVAYLVLTGVYAALTIFYLIYVVRRRNRMPIRTVAVLSTLGILIILTYIVERLTHTHVSYLSIGYLIAMLLLVVIHNHTELYDMTANIATSVEKTHQQGYLIFDKKLRFIKGNSYIMELFPEISRDWKTDTPVPQSDSFLYTNVISWFTEIHDDEDALKESLTIHYKDSYYEVQIHQIVRSTRRVEGFVVEFIDRTSENHYLNMLQNYNEDLKNEVARQTEHVTRIQSMTIMGMATMIESRDNGTGGHIRRTSGVVGIFSKRLLGEKTKFNLSTEFLKMVEKAAPMHDLGKISVEDRILRKHGKCTEEEFAEIKKHPSEGARIVRCILNDVESDEFVAIAANMAHYHHERWDGQGYPTGKAGEDIPIEARIMALADVFDALVSERSYKEAYSYDAAFSVIENSLGSHFDPELGKVFLECRSELEAFYNEAK